MSDKSRPIYRVTVEKYGPGLNGEGYSSKPDAEWRFCQIYQQTIYGEFDHQLLIHDINETCKDVT